MVDGRWLKFIISASTIGRPPYTFGRHLSIVDKLGKLKHVQKYKMRKKLRCYHRKTRASWRLRPCIRGCICELDGACSAERSLVGEHRYHYKKARRTKKSWAE